MPKEKQNKLSEENWEKDYDLFGDYIVDPMKHFSEDPLFQEIRLAIRKYIIQEKAQTFQKCKKEMAGILKKIEKDLFNSCKVGGESVEKWWDKEKEKIQKEIEKLE